MEDIKTLVLSSYSYLMNETLERISNGKYYDLNLKSYTEKFIRTSLKYFEDREEYEKCQTLLTFINIRYNHDKNYKLK